MGHGDTFSFYSDFSEKQFHIKINSIQMKETEEENKKTNDEVGDKSEGWGWKGEGRLMPRCGEQVDCMGAAWLVGDSRKGRSGAASISSMKEVAECGSLLGISSFSK